MAEAGLDEKAGDVIVFPGHFPDACPEGERVVGCADAKLGQQTDFHLPGPGGGGEALHLGSGAAQTIGQLLDEGLVVVVEPGCSGKGYGLGIDRFGRPENAEVVEERRAQGEARALQPAQLPLGDGPRGRQQGLARDRERVADHSRRPLGPWQRPKGGQLGHQDDVTVKTCGSYVIHFVALRTWHQFEIASGHENSVGHFFLKLKDRAIKVLKLESKHKWGREG